MHKTVGAVLVFIICQTTLAADISSVNVCFSPKGNCAQQIISAIFQAKKQILVQAYSFTSVPISQALVDAKNRGIDVEVLLDKSQLRGRNSVLNYLEAQKIPTLIDYVPAIAHNKVMVIDGGTVITGSYNFTAGAEYRNAENLLIIHDQDLAKKYTSNWLKRQSVSKVL
jgi:phosphatidylserine/phosphatidylglycerophosphate/cardiolipin synthase-like enzyme